MKKKIILLTTIICLFVALAVPTFAWTTEVDGSTQEFAFIDNKGIVSMGQPGYFNSNLKQTIKGYSYNNGWFYRNDENISGQIQARFDNNQYTVNISHTSTFRFINTYNPMDFNINIGNFNDEKGFSIEDFGSELTITSMDSANKVEHSWQQVSENTTTLNAYSVLTYNLNIDTYLQRLTISKTVSYQGYVTEYSRTADISMYPITYAQGLRYIIPQYFTEYPESFQVFAFNVDTVTCPPAFLDNPSIFTQAYNFTYNTAYEAGETVGDQKGYARGYKVGLDSGELKGYNNGYEVGFSDGEAEANQEFKNTYGNNEAITNFFNGFGSAVWNFCGNILNYEFLPDFNVGTVLFIFLGAGFVILLLKLLISTKGGIVG